MYNICGRSATFNVNVKPLFFSFLFFLFFFLFFGQIRKLGQVLQRLQSRDIQRGLKRHHKVFPGKEAVELLIDSGMARDAMDALAIGNAFLREFFFLYCGSLPLKTTQ